MSRRCPCRLRRSRGSRRGTVYVAVLGTSLLVTVIGLGALALARTQARIARAETQMAGAREAARAGFEIAAAELAASDAWRGRSSGVWRSDVGVGDGTYTVSIDDPSDGSLGNGDGDPVRLEVTGRRGSARQQLAATLLVRDHVDALAARIVSGGGIGITDTTIRGSGPLRANASVSANGSSVAPDVVAGTTISGTGYGGITTAGGAVITVPDVAALAASERAGAGEIDRRMLTPEAADQLGSGSFEVGLGDWTSSDASTEIGVDTSAAVHGARSMLVWNRPSETAGARLDITPLVRAGLRPRATARVRVEPIGTKADFELWLSWVQGGTVTVDAGPRVTASGEWVDLSVTATFTSPQLVDSATLMIVTPGDTVTHRIDDVRLTDATLATPPLVMERIVLGPDHNPVGTTSASGRYVLDAGGRSVVIRDCRIHGTIILLNAGTDSRIEGSVAWTPVVPGDPILIADALVLRLATDSAPLSEAGLGVNLDPAALPDIVAGRSGTTTLDAVVPSRLEGIILVSGTTMVSGRPHLAGTLISEGSIAFTNADVVLEAGAVAADRVPSGFTADRTQAIVVPGTFARVIDAP